jgi:hypothetical protein
MRNTFLRLSFKAQPPTAVQQDSCLLALPESLLVRIAAGVPSGLDRRAGGWWAAPGRR